jgi:hypothetical protein
MGVRRGEQVVVPLIPEFIRNEEGGESSMTVNGMRRNDG